MSCFACMLLLLDVLCMLLSETEADVCNVRCAVVPTWHAVKHRCQLTECYQALAEIS